MNVDNLRLAKDMKYEALYWALGFEELDKNLIYDNKTEFDIPPQYIKSSYPVVIIDKTVNDGNGVDKWLSNNAY